MSELRYPTGEPVEAMLLTVQEVARLLGISVRSVWSYTSSGEIPRPVHPFGRLTRWRRTDLEEWAKGLQS